MGTNETFGRPTICKLWADRLRYFTLTRRKNEAGASSGVTVVLNSMRYIIERQSLGA